MASTKTKPTEEDLANAYERLSNLESRKGVRSAQYPNMQHGYQAGGVSRAPEATPVADAAKDVARLPVLKQYGDAIDDRVQRVKPLFRGKPEEPKPAPKRPVGPSASVDEIAASVAPRPERPVYGPTATGEEIAAQTLGPGAEPKKPGAEPTTVTGSGTRHTTETRADTNERTAGELDEYAAAQARLRAGPVRDADLRYVQGYEGGDAEPIAVMPRQEEQPTASGAPPGPPEPGYGARVAQNYRNYASAGAPGLVVGALRGMRRARR